MTEELVVSDQAVNAESETTKKPMMMILCHELNAANARMKHVLRMFSMRKKYSEQQATDDDKPYYDVDSTNAVFEVIEEEARTINNLCHFAVEELELRRSDNQKLELENLNKTSHIIDLTFEKQTLRREMLHLGRAYDKIEDRGGLTIPRGIKDQKNNFCDIIVTCKDLAERSSGLFTNDAVMLSNEDHTKEVSFFYCTSIIHIFHFIINQ